MKRLPFLARALRYAVAAFAAGALLAGCASVGRPNEGNCTGPPDFCNVFFGG